MAIDNEKKSSRLLASRRYTHDTLGSSQEAFTQVLDLGASEIYSETNLIPASSLPFSGSTQQRGTDGVLKYYYRQKLTPSNLNNEVWFFLDPPSDSADGIGAQLIDDNQQTNFISPKYSVTSLANANTEDSPSPGYNVKVFKSTSTNSGSLTNTSLVSSTDYEFDYKTGVLQFLNSSVDPSDSEYVYITAYQYVGKTVSEKVVTDEIIASGNISASGTGSFNRLGVGTNTPNKALEVIGDISASGHISASTMRAETGSFRDVLVDDNLFLGGIALENISIAFDSGSTRFGSSSLHTHEFTGSVFISGSSLQLNGKDVALKDNISGSFGDVSHSLQLRIKATESELGNTLVSGSAQISFNGISDVPVDIISSSAQIESEISGAIDAATASLLSSYTFISESAQVNADSITNFDTNVKDKLNTEAVISSSAQIKTEITGAFAAASHSLQSRITIAETELNNTLISSSAQIAAEISGAFDAIGLISSSAQIESEISGAIDAATASLLSSYTFISSSAQIESEISGAMAGITSSFVVSSQTGSFVVSSQTGSFVVNSQTGSFVVSSQTGSFLTSMSAGTYSSSLQTLGNITSSGAISASSHLFFSASKNSSTSLKTLVINTNTGQVFHTGSYAGGGGGGGGGFDAVGEDILPDGSHNLGAFDKKWQAIFAEDTFFGGIHEINLETKGLDQLQAGTVLVSKAGQMVPCTTEADPLIMGIVSSGSNFPIILGAEPVLVNGPVYEGDYIITSNIIGHGRAVNPSKIFELQLFGKIIAQSLETKPEGGLIRAMIRKM